MPPNRNLARIRRLAPEAEVHPTTSLGGLMGTPTGQPEAASYPVPRFPAPGDPQQTAPRGMNAVEGVDYECYNSTVGECHVRLLGCAFSEGDNVELTFNYQSDKDLIELLMVADAIKRAKAKISWLTIPYVPFSRQDRVVTGKGDPFSLAVVATLINSIEARHVRVYDPHSDVMGALIKNMVEVSQYEIFQRYLPTDGNFYFVSPDGGALKKTYALAAKIKNLGIVECSRKRGATEGALPGIKINYDGSLAGKRFIIVDDICDDGLIFAEIGKALKDLGAREVVLMVTHGFFTGGFEVFDGAIDHIWTRQGLIR